MKKICFIFLLASAFCGCSTDFDTVAPWKETMVVYGLLNPNDNVQYIRISKAYLGEGNAVVMAKVADSIYYGNVLIVKMERYQNNVLMDTYNFNRVDTIPKETDGTFASPLEIVYATNQLLPQPSANDGNVYKLTITNQTTGNVVSASTKLIENYTISSPNTVSNYKFNSPGGLTWRIMSSLSGKVYGINQKINYVEINTVTLDTTYKSIDWYLGDKVSVSDVQSEIRFPFASTDLYRLLGGNIAVDPDKTRHLDANPIDVYVSAGTEELYTYMQVSEQNTGIVQDKPLYTNIQNGIGLFTCRNTRKISIHLSTDSYAALDTSAYTKDLNFTH